MTVERVPARGAALRARLGPERLAALRTVLGLFATFELTVWTVAALATLKLTSNGPVNDPDGLTRPLRPLANAVIAPLARYDSAWYLGVASHGYGPAHEGLTRFMGFFPLYPLLVHGLALPAGGSRTALVLAASLVSAASLLGALYLVHRLVELELGTRVARPVLVLLLCFPTAFFLAAPYTESLFLLLSVGAIYAARLDRWALAGVAGALASGTRLAGLLLLIPLVLFQLWGPGVRRPRWSVLWLALVPLGALAFFGYLQLRYGAPRAYFTIQERYWHHHLVDPVTAVTRPFTAAYGALRDLYHGAPFDIGTRARIDAVTRLGFVVVALAAIAGLARRLHLAYAAYTAASLALVLISPPHTGVARYMMVVFPLFMWLALLTERRGVTEHVARFSAALLGVLTAAFATWHFVG